MTIQDDVLDLRVADDPPARGLPRDFIWGVSTSSYRRYVRMIRAEAMEAVR